MRAHRQQALDQPVIYRVVGDFAQRFGLDAAEQPDRQVRYLDGTAADPVEEETFVTSVTKFFMGIFSGGGDEAAPGALVVPAAPPDE